MIVKQNFLRNLLLAIFLAFAWRTDAQSFVLSSNRWLIVVDTSAAMESRQQATMDSVGAMLLSGMNGQLRPGDTIGIWTFNETLSKGKFPLQLWHPDVTQSIAAGAAQFLTSLKYQKSTKFECVMPDIHRLVTNSDILTVILLTDGDATLKGTPYDDTINATFKKDFRTQKKAKAPFIVAFRSEGGRITAFTLTPAPWLATFPPLPPAPVAVAEAPAPAVAPAPEPPAPVVPSIIMTGTNAAAEPTTPEAQAPITLYSNSLTNLAPEPALINTQSIATMTADTQAIATVSIDTNVPPPENVTPQIAPQIPETPTAPTVQTPPTPAPAEPMPVTTTVPKDETTRAEIANFEAAHTGDVKVVSSAGRPMPENASPSSLTVTQALAATPPVVPAVALTPASGTQTRLFLGIGLLIIAVAIGVFWMRKSRPPSSGSLITRSIDRDKRN